MKSVLDYLWYTACKFAGNCAGFQWSFLSFIVVQMIEECCFAMIYTCDANLGIQFHKLQSKWQKTLKF